MCAKHRSAVLAEIRERLTAGQPCRVVSTSLIEAGVDVSFPSVLRAEAGLDSVAQAAGRCNRNKEWPVDASEVLVFANANSHWRPPRSEEKRCEIHSLRGISYAVFCSKKKTLYRSLIVDNFRLTQQHV